ncbi:MAG: hypothetical protein LBC28_00695, partial [Oscillospiraceae bacterium]|nr:hypothetical protein [Oscillospiraceae bacterium]
MRLATSYFKPSGALFRENLKRFWAVPALGMLCWFFAGIFPILVENGGITNWLRMAAEMRHPAFLIFTPIFPLMASAAALRYLFSPGAVAAMHKLTLTRGRLYCTSFVYAAAMSLAPAAVTYLVLGVAGIPEGFNMLPAFALTALLTLFYTALFHVAAMLTGNSVMHLGACAFLSFALPALVMLVGAYCQTLLFGYDGETVTGTLALRLVPLFYVFDESVLQSAGWMASYILAVPALYAAGAALYARRPLEKAGDSIVFPFFELIFTFVVAFAGMSLMSLLFDSAGWGYFPLNSGLVIGAAISFVMARMVSKKSLRVFNKSTLANGGVFAAAAALLLSVLSFDLTGYELRVPSPERVASVEVSRSFIDPLSDRYFYGFYASNNGNLVFTEPENIRAVTELHRDITELRDSYGHRGVNNRMWFGRLSTSIYLRYDTGPGALSRRYYTPTDQIMNDANTRTLFESEEFKLQNDVTNGAFGRPDRISINAFFGEYYRDPDAVDDAPMSSSITLSSDEYGELLGALSADMRGETWEQFTSYPFSYVTVNIDYVSERPETQGGLRSAGAAIPVPTHYARTMAWLT